MGLQGPQRVPQWEDLVENQKMVFKNSSGETPVCTTERGSHTPSQGVLTWSV